MVGTLALVLLCVSLGWPAAPDLAGPRVGMAVSGCAISIALSLLLSPDHAEVAVQNVAICSGEHAQPPRAAPRAAVPLDAVLRHAARMALAVSIAAAVAAWLNLWHAGPQRVDRVRACVRCATRLAGPE